MHEPHYILIAMQSHKRISLLCNTFARSNGVMLLEHKAYDKEQIKNTRTYHPCMNATLVQLEYNKILTLVQMKLGVTREIQGDGG
jgi:hypothetical protein